MPRSDLVSLIIRLAIGLVILAIIGYLLFIRLRKPRVTTNPTPTPSDTPVVIITDEAPTIIPSPSLPEIGDSAAATPSGTVGRNVYGSGYYAPSTTTHRTTRTTHTTTPGTAYTTVTYYPGGQTTTSSASSSSSSASAQASGSSAHSSATATSGSASASASASSSSSSQ